MNKAILKLVFVVLLAVLMVALIVVTAYGVYNLISQTPQKGDQPVGVVENLSKIDSLSALLDLKERQLNSVELVLVETYQAKDSVETVSRKAENKAQYYKQQYLNNKNTQNCDSALQAYDSLVVEQRLTIQIDSAIIFHQKLVIGYLKDKVEYADSTSSYWRNIAEAHKVDYKALNYYREFRSEHKFKSWLVGLKSK